MSNRNERLNDEFELNIPTAMPENVFDLEPQVCAHLWLDESEESSLVLAECRDLGLPVLVEQQIAGVHNFPWAQRDDGEIYPMRRGEYFPAAALVVGEWAGRSYVTAWMIGHMVIVPAEQLKRYREGLPPPKRSDDDT